MEDMRSVTSPYADAVDSFMASRHDLKPSTRKGYLAGLRRFGAYTDRATLASVNSVSVNVYIEDCLKRRRKFLAHHDARALRLFSAWLVRARILPSDPLVGVVVPKQPKKRRQPFTTEDVALIRATARRADLGDRDETIIVMAIGCGLRLDEMRNLMWPEDVDLRRGFLYVRERAAKTDSSIRRIPLDPEIRSLLDLYVKDTRPRPVDFAGNFFLNAHGDPFTYYGFTSIFRRLKNKLPREMDFKIHRGRNTFITDQLRQGTDLYVAMKLAGHKSPKVTEGYAGELSDDELKRLTKPAFSVLHGRRAS
jgi:integrase